MIVKATRIHLQSSESDSGPDDRNPPPSKKDKSKDKSGPLMENGEPAWKLGQNKKVKIREFKGKTYIDIREWYADKKDMDITIKVIDWCEQHKNDPEPEKEEESKDGERKQKQIVKLEGEMKSS